MIYERRFVIIIKKVSLFDCLDHFLRELIISDSNTGLMFVLSTRHLTHCLRLGKGGGLSDT